MSFLQWVTPCLVRRIRTFPLTPHSTCWAWGRRQRDRQRRPRGWCKVTTLTQVWSEPNIMLLLFQVKAPIFRRCPPHRAVGLWPTLTPRHTSAARTPARPCIMWGAKKSSSHAQHQKNCFSPVGASLTREAPTCSCMTPLTATTSLQRTSSKTLATRTTVQRISTMEVWWAVSGTVRLRTTGDWVDMIMTWVTWSIIHPFSSHMAGHAPPQQQLLPGQIIAQQAAQQQQQKMMAQQQQQQGAYGECLKKPQLCVWPFNLIFHHCRRIPPAPRWVQHWHCHLQGRPSSPAASKRTIAQCNLQISSS